MTRKIEVEARGLLDRAGDNPGMTGLDPEPSLHSLKNTERGNHPVHPAGGGDDIGIDNIVFAVPAPGGLALLGMAGLIAGRRRRR